MSLVHNPVPQGRGNSDSDTPLRPMLSRQDTDLLSYYQSSLADRGSPQKPHQRQSSGDSSSSSEYSTGSSDYSSRTPDSPPNRRQRTSIPSEGGSDRRRMAIIEMDQGRTAQANPVKSSDGRSRRIRPSLDNLALVAPPDASIKSYSSLTPPPTAPISGTLDFHVEQPEKGHQRSASEAVAKKSTSPRNVSIVGSSRVLPPLVIESLSSADIVDTTALHPPIFLHPQARSPSPAMSAISAISESSLVVTPGLGEGKSIDMPVAAPVITKLASHSAQPTQNDDIHRAAQYLDYQPGIHATAGPLPTPPRSSFDSPPPRPPRRHSPSPNRRREMELVKQALQLPPSVTAALSSFPPSPVISNVSSIQNVPSVELKSDDHNSGSHRREGAFSPSQADSVSSTYDIGPIKHQRMPGMDSVMAMSRSSSTDVHSIVVQPPRDQAADDMYNDGWVSVARERNMSPECRISTEERSSAEFSSNSHSPSNSLSTAPSLPPKSPKGFRNSLSRGLKRMSLPRTPSMKSSSRSSSDGRHSGSLPRTPSPPLIRPRMKIKTLYPAAMYCHEVHGQRSAQERCTIYAQKINELYSCDCGLGDWVFEAQIRRPNGSHSTLKLNPPPVHQFSPQPRHTSRSSVISEATFPSRPDASAATDLSQQSVSDHSLPNSPPPLPYPALAMNQQRANLPPSAAMRLLGSGTPSKTGNFFASLGRKASIRKDRTLGAPNATPPTRLTKNPPTPARITNPTVPGGPRAPTNRMLRSQTIMLSSPFSSNSSLSEKNGPLHRRPSLNNTSTTETAIDLNDDPEFIKHLDKLSDVLPHAERAVLAGYLRRAGQDIMAIGQYLEDEKNGNIRES
ncbi:hypothetical protein C8J56DRAFT_825421 [Mycena floridula]|nr:hypothetical protein C8J56DRAFT_825421 [Mycena floridula]